MTIMTITTITTINDKNDNGMLRHHKTTKPYNVDPRYNVNKAINLGLTNRNVAI